MLRFIDNYLNQITMYRLVHFVLIFLLVWAGVLGFFGILPYSPIAIAFSAFFFAYVCGVVNYFLGKFFKVPTNIDSFYITGLILALIITPPQSWSQYLSFIVFAFSASLFAMLSKYLLNIKKKHIFNPAAVAVVLTGLVLGRYASWWVGTLAMLPLVVFFGLLIIRKVQRFSLVLSFLTVALVVTTLSYSPNHWLAILRLVLIGSPLLFFAFIMLTEPLTTPPTKKLQMIYGGLVGLMFLPGAHVGPIYFSPEMALLFGNLFAYVVSPKQKLVLVLKQKVQAAKDVYDFVFTSDQKIQFRPGQYLEWALGHRKPDSRGNRRYFTIASSPTEPEVRIGVKFYPKSSSFKNSLVRMNVGDKIFASQLAGDFILSSDAKQKLVFIAGGIGVTPFRSMVKYLLDIDQSRSIVLFYSNNTTSEIAYKEVFDEANRRLGMKTIYALTDLNQIPNDWTGHKGFIDATLIKLEVPDYLDRMFYISGPRSMVTAFESVLKSLGVKKQQIKVDFFPGLV